jgi:chemotaxis protein CheX
MNSFKLDPRLTAEQAGPLRDSLLSQRGAPLALDAGEVERLGGSCFQVLAAARKTWAADGQPLTFAQPSPAFAAGLALLGAAGWMSQEDLAS